MANEDEDEQQPHEQLEFDPAPLGEEGAWGAEIARAAGVGAGSATSGPGGQQHTCTLWPHIHNTDGFFVARWRRVR